MSLCPNYCECKPCRHGVQTCTYRCELCELEHQRIVDQAAHEESIRRQRNKLKPRWKGAETL